MATIERKVKGSVSGIPDLSLADRERMFFLLTEYFDGYEYKRFLSDLEEKDGAVILRSIDEVIQGFTTFQFLSGIVDGQPTRAVFSGDTIIYRDFQNQIVLPKVWGSFMLNMAVSEKTPMYWFLICSGYKTYRFLSTFFLDYYPRQNAETPTFEMHTLNNFATQKFGNLYNPQTGLIRFADSQERLKPEVAPITDQRLHNPDIRFFLSQNPDHARGVELACIAEISPRNYSPFIKRVIGYREK